MKSFTVFTFMLFNGFFLMAQEETPMIPDTIPVVKIAEDSAATTLMPETAELVATDSTTTQKKKKKKKKKKSLRGFFTKDYPIPKRAMLLSFIIPGAGQAYNKKYWKIPIAIGGTATAIYFVQENTRTYRLLRDEYKSRLDPNSNIEADPRFVNWANEDIRAERDRRNKWKEMSYIGLVLVQALGGVDAFVDAHLHGYEINEDLTMKIKPSFQTTTADATALGVGISFHLMAPPPAQPKNFFGTTK